MLRLMVVQRFLMLEHLQPTVTGNATVVNDAGLNFAASTVGGALNASCDASGNMLTDSGALAITGTSSFTTSTE